MLYYFVPREITKKEVAMDSNDLSFGCTHSNVIRERILGMAPLASQGNMPCDFLSLFFFGVLALADINITFFALFASFALLRVDDRPVTCGVILFNAPFFELIGVLVLPRNG